MKIAVVGATGMVGQVMLKVLEERNLPITELIPVASEKSVGKKVTYKGKEFSIVSMDTAIAMKPEIAIFSAGGNTSLEYAPKFAEVGTVVIDNSSAWRMDPTKKLVVPEINASELTKEDKIIANPNCSTIQMVMVLNPLHKKYKIKRVIVSTYQSVSGTGKIEFSELQEASSKPPLEPIQERESEKQKEIAAIVIQRLCRKHQACESLRLLHIEKQKTTYTSYAPNEVSKLDDCVVETVGDYVIVCVSEDSSSVQSIIDQYTK